MVRQFEATGSIGSGERYCRTSPELRVALNNTGIPHGHVSTVLRICGVRGVDVILSDRKTIHRWGTAKQKERKVILYRHSIKVLIHELAHIVAYDRCTKRGWGHSSFFSRVMDEMIEKYTREHPVTAEALLEAKSLLKTPGNVDTIRFGVRVGDEVEFDFRQKCCRGTVLSKGPKRALVRVSTGRKWLELHVPWPLVRHTKSQPE